MPELLGRERGVIWAMPERKPFFKGGLPLLHVNFILVIVYSFVYFINFELSKKYYAVNTCGE